MLKGNIFFTNDKNVVLSNAMNYTIICVSGDSHLYQDLIQSTNAHVASLLTPNYDAVMMELDGNRGGFINSYTYQLNNVECGEYLAMILYSLYIGKNILLYLTEEESKMSYFLFLLQFIQAVYGLTIMNDPNLSTFDINFSQVVLDEFFLYNFITIDNYLSTRTKPYGVHEIDIINKIISQLNTTSISNIQEAIMVLNKLYECKVNNKPIPNVIY